MTKLKPKIFIGSSSEARNAVGAFCDCLKSDAIVVPWWLSPEFQAMHSTLESLLEACNQYDFGIFVLTPDDKFESRDEKGYSARDNVLFELGLFLGKLGANRVFAVVQEGENKKKKVKIPSDLFGIHLPRFSHGDPRTLIASVNTAASSIRPIIARESRRHGRIKLVRGWGYDTDKMEFSMTLSAVKLERNRNELNDRALVVVVRKASDGIDFEHDKKIAIGEPRKLSRFSDGDLMLRTDGSKILGDVSPGDEVCGYLLLIPENYEIGQAATVAEMINEGAELLESKSAAFQ